MKKIIIGFSGLFVLAFVVILFVNGQTNTDKEKKASAEVTRECAPCPFASAHKALSDTETNQVAKCDPSKCKEMGCDPAGCKEGKFDPAKCKANCPVVNGGMKKCNPAGCMGSAKK